MDQRLSSNYPNVPPSSSSSSLESFANCPSIELSNRVKMPLIGLGTTHSGGYHHNSVVYALKDCSYRMIDTAKRYGVERQIGLAIKESGIPRSSIFLATKLWPVDLGNSATHMACKRSCELLGTDYLDLYMIHLPVVPNWFTKPREIQEETWRALEHLYDEGTIKAIGVSNYSENDLDELLEYCSIKPHVNQCEFHVCYNNKLLIEYCRDEKIVFTGYCPLAKGTILNEEVINAIAKKHNKSAAQICIKWSVQQGIPAIPKSRKFERIAENCQIFDFLLDYEDFNLLSTLPSKKVIRLHNLQEKFLYSDGYKLQEQPLSIPELPNYINDFSGSDPSFLSTSLSNSTGLVA